MGYNEQVNAYGFRDAPDRARTLFREGDREAAVDAISDRMVSELTVSGTESDVREQLRQYARHGADVVITMPSMDASVDDIESLIDVLGSSETGTFRDSAAIERSTATVRISAFLSMVWICLASTPRST